MPYRSVAEIEKRRLERDSFEKQDLEEDLLERRYEEALARIRRSRLSRFLSGKTPKVFKRSPPGRASKRRLRF